MEYIENEVENRGMETMYFHGDLRWHPGGGNIKINNEQINFIDWESAGFGEYNHVEIGDVIASIPDPENNKKRIEMIINEYVSNKERSKTQIMDQITFTLKYSKLTDLLWSAQKYLLMKQKGEPEWKKYKEMTEYRMQAGEVFYKDGFIKQFLNFVT